MKTLHQGLSRIVVAGALLLAATALAAAQYHHGEGEWIPLGEARVDGHADHDDIHVGNHGPFRALRLHVNGNAVEFEHVVIHFRHGHAETFPAAFVVQNGASSPYIDLPGEAREIDSVEMWYKRGSWGGKPTVTLFGRR